MYLVILSAFGVGVRRRSGRHWIELIIINIRVRWSLIEKKKELDEFKRGETEFV
jgi:hypothetical protein